MDQLELFLDEEQVISNPSEQQLEIIKMVSAIIKKTKFPKCKLGIGRFVKKDGSISEQTDQIKIELLGSPRLVTITYPTNKKNKWLVSVACYAKEMRDPNIWNLLIGLNYIKEDNVLTFKCDHNLEGLQKVLSEIEPLIISRFNSLYDHRAVEPVCCGQQQNCINAGKCVLVNHEMAMKCSFMKLMEREGKFNGGYDA